jgi:hypothetical protein
VATSLIAQFLELNPDLTQLQLDVFRDNDAAVGLYDKLGFATQSSGAWVTRPLPVADGFVEVASLPTSLAAHRAYGFCELDIVGPVHSVRIGLLGEKVLKCPTADTFMNDRLLAALRQTFHGVDRAFAVLPLAEASELAVEHEVVNLTDRMTLALR